MCNIDNSKILIYDEVADWMARGKMFTSVDIANSMKEKGSDIRNKDVAEYLRAHYKGAAGNVGEDYRQESIEVQLKDGSYATAFLYLPAWEDPQNYTTRSQVALPPKGTTVYTQGDEPDSSFTKDESDSSPKLVGWRDLEPGELKAYSSPPAQNIVINIHNVDTLIVTPNSEMSIDSHTEECVEED